MRRLRVGLVNLPPGRFGLSANKFTPFAQAQRLCRPHYGGLQVVLLDEAWPNAGESLRDKGGRGSSGQSRKNGSGARNRRGRCAERRPCDASRAAPRTGLRLPARRPPLLAGGPERSRRTRRLSNNTGAGARPAFPTRNEPIEDNERAIVYAVILRRSVRSTEPRRTTARIIGGRSSFEARFRSHLRMTE
jgi:hypothetical protein